ncbi:MAG: hypothetical protein ABIH08_06500 [Candidatus Omnitrophota bacterium]
MLTKYFKDKNKEWESLCIRCGGCCGAYDDPCEHLKKEKTGKFYCKIYTQRFGEHISVKGEKFDCVPVQEILKTHWKKDYLCVYKKLSKQGWAKQNE